MQPTLIHDGVSYYESRLYTARQMKDAVKLCNNFFYFDPPGSAVTATEIEDFLCYEGGHGDRVYGSPHDSAAEVWLLFSHERPLRRITTPSNYKGPRYKPTGGWASRPEALLMIYPCIEELGGTYIGTEAFARDPWCDVIAAARWLHTRQLTASHTFGDVNELRASATESDTPLQLALKSLGYFCDFFDKESETYEFSYLLRPRERVNTLYRDPFLSPRKKGSNPS